MTPQPCDLLVANATLFTANEANEVIDDGAIAIACGVILRVGRTDEIAPLFRPTERIDAGGGIVHPGFIDTHIHISQYTARTALPAMARATDAGRPTAMGHWKEKLTPEDERASAMLAAMDMLRAGYTGFVDPGTVLNTDAVAGAAEDIGLRVWLTDPYVGDLAHVLVENFPDFFGGSFLNVWTKSLDEALARLGGELHRNRNATSTVRGYVGIYGEGTDSFELHAAALELAESADVPFQKHLGYAPHTLALLADEHAAPPLGALADRGLLTPRVSLTHFNACTPQDIGLLSATGAGLIWCPYGQLSMIGKDSVEGRMASAEAAGVRVSLATDIPRAFNFGDLAKLGWLSGLAAGDTARAEQLFLMQTRHAAAAMSALAELGSLEAGKSADFVVRAASDRPGLDHFLEGIVIGGAEPVRHSFVAGKALIRDGVIVPVDEVAERRKVGLSVKRLMCEVGLSD